MKASCVAVLCALAAAGAAQASPLHHAAKPQPAPTATLVASDAGSAQAAVGGCGYGTAGVAVTFRAGSQPAVLARYGTDAGGCFSGTTQLPAPGGYSVTATGTNGASASTTVVVTGSPPVL